MKLSTRSRLVASSTRLEISTPRFHHRSPFRFVCNLGRIKWTPTELFDRHEISDFGSMRAVIVLISTNSLEQGLELVEAWREAGVDVHVRLSTLLKRPAIGNASDHLFLGTLDTEDCYLYTPQGWVPSPKLKSLFAELFADDPHVTVE